MLRKGIFPINLNLDIEFYNKLHFVNNRQEFEYVRSYLTEAYTIGVSDR